MLAGWEDMDQLEDMDKAILATFYLSGATASHPMKKSIAIHAVKDVVRSTGIDVDVVQHFEEAFDELLSAFHGQDSLNLLEYRWLARKTLYLDIGPKLDEFRLTSSGQELVAKGLSMVPSLVAKTWISWISSDDMDKAIGAVFYLHGATEWEPMDKSRVILAVKAVIGCAGIDTDDAQGFDEAFHELLAAFDGQNTLNLQEFQSLVHEASVLDIPGPELDEFRLTSSGQAMVAEGFPMILERAERQAEAEDDAH